MSDPSPAAPFRAGFVTVVGRPNVGKSTLVNTLVGQKVAIVSDKPQTTRNRILAVVNRPGVQLVLFDTPGIHKPRHEMNRRMVDTAVKSIGQGDVVLWVNEANEAPGPSDAFIQRLLAKSGLPVVLALNKIDTLTKPRVLPAIETWSHFGRFDDIVPISALKGENVDRLESVLVAKLPEGSALYPDEFLTDLPERFFVAEIVRERILHHTREEIPYSTGVVIDSFQEAEDIVRIQASILVERANQKGILIGRGGSMLKRIGTEARHQLEDFLGTKVFLGLFVKVREHWRENQGILGAMGLGESGGRLVGGPSRDEPEEPEA
jgi:GTP-binding protein Era